MELAPSALAIAVAACAAAAPEPARAGGAAEYPYDWGVAYYMSYDNNLEVWGKPIIDAIRSGVASARTVAAVQADFTDPGGMRRFTLKSSGAEEVGIKAENSASEDAVIAYLQWFVERFRCRRYVFTFLNHGGRIDEMCADERPGGAAGPQWMSGRVLGEKLRKLQHKLEGRIELLFLQQCGRGSVENLYSFRGAARFIMSSPVPVGAPNTYYTAVHRWLGVAPAETNGADVAARIAMKDQHYTIYTCLRTSALEELPRRLDAAFAPFLALKKLVPAPAQHVIHPVGEPIVDAAAFLKALSEANGGAGRDDAAALLAWVNKELFVAPPARREPRGGAQALSGLSIFVPRSAREARRYRALDLYQKSRLPALWERLTATPQPPPKEPELLFWR